MKTTLQNIDSLINPLRWLADKIGAPMLDLTIRLYMAWIFFKSGLVRFNDWQNGTFDNQITAFTDWHPVPGIDPALAAYGATAGEIILPILLAVGLFTRFGAAGLLVITLVIEFVVPAEYGVANSIHYFYLLLLAVPFIRGPGTLSLDALLRHFIWKAKKEEHGQQHSLSAQTA